MNLVITLILIAKIERVLNFSVHRRWKDPPLSSELKHKRGFISPFLREPPREWRDLDGRRAVNIDVKVATQKNNLKLDLIKELENELKDQNFSAFDTDFTTPCPNCKRLVAENKVLMQEIDSLATMDSVTGKGPCPGCKKIIMENIALKQNAALSSVIFADEMQPAYPCDEWDPKSRTCWLDRNIGDTVTFVLAFNRGANPHVQWGQEFHIFQSLKTEEYVIDPENPLWNIVIGSKGHEMRISPITEIDVDFNFFSATILAHRHPMHKVIDSPPVEKLNFKIRLMAVDQGFVYPGETLMLNMKRVNLPPTSMKFKWYLEKDGEYGTLPSNMRLSPSGGVLTISELRKEQEGILVCAVFTNKDYFATKQRFLIKEMNQSNNMLLFMPTRPPVQSNRWRRGTNNEGFVELSAIDTENSIPIPGLESKSSSTEEQSKRQDFSEMGLPYESNARRVDRQFVPSDDQMGQLPNRPIPTYNRPAAASNPESIQGIEGRPISDMTPADMPILKAVKQEQTENRLTISNEPPNSPIDQYSENNKEEIILELEKKMDTSASKAQDHLSQMISTCISDMQCSADALCIQRDPKVPGFCRCTEGFQGNGIFCWEEIKVRSAAVYSEHQLGESVATVMINEMENSQSNLAPTPNTEIPPNM
ncbi:uncharacterized protein NPIL_229091 [Nephila pilipes]|uniref:Ig-like domain-containing protein n=1 Tax=Nephila pilipes TaxID=299642 RepID=A0A8X6MLZ2_NEPPI|nr:uncharacterized protein NPIL_229091 [Nephila pilipes]